MAHLHLPNVSRRGFLLGAGGAFVLAACGSGDSQANTDGTGSDGTGDELPPINLIPTFPATNRYLVRERPQRLTYTLRDQDNVALTDTPDTLDIQLYYEGLPRAGGETDDLHEATGDPFVATRYSDGIPIPYYMFRWTPEQEGIYTAVATVDGEEVTSSLWVYPPAEVTLTQVGDPMIPTETPTPDAPLDVDPICTREPQCELHDVSMPDFLDEGRPVAFLISTPAYCQIGICGPVLDLVIDAAAEYPDIGFVHCEVYTNPNEVTDIGSAEVFGALTAYGYNFEPSLILADSNGIMVDRLDTIYDRVELNEALAALS